MTDIDYDTWMLSGSSVMMNGITIKNNYACDLDSLVKGTRIGMMRHADATLHYYINGIDQGVACTNIPEGLWAVIDLYGQCSQVTLVHHPIFLEQCNGEQSDEDPEGVAGATANESERGKGTHHHVPQLQLVDTTEVAPKKDLLHRFSYCHGAEVCVTGEVRNIAYRSPAMMTVKNKSSSSAAPRGASHNGLVFSESPLHNEELFEVKIRVLDGRFSGGIRIGLTTLPLGPNLSLSFVPPSLSIVHPVPHSSTWWIGGADVYLNSNSDKSALDMNPQGVNGSALSTTGDTLGAGKQGTNSAVGKMDSTWAINVLKYNFCPHFNNLSEGDRVGIKRSADGTMRLFINGLDFGVAASGVSLGRIHGVVEMYGSCVSVETTSIGRNIVSPDGRNIAVGTVSQDSLEISTPQQRRVSITTAETAAVVSRTNNTVPDTTTNLISGDSFPSNFRFNTKCSFQFSEKHGKNIVLSVDRLHATRSKGFDQGLLFSSRPLPRNTLFHFRVGACNASLSGGLMLGVTSSNSSSLLSLANNCSSALHLLPLSNSWLICSNGVYYQNEKISNPFGPNLDTIAPGTTLGLCIDVEARLHLFVNGRNCGIVAKRIPNNPYVFVDLYGSITEVNICSNLDISNNAAGPAECTMKKKTQHNSNQQQLLRHQYNAQQAAAAVAAAATAEGTFLFSSHDEANLAISRSMTSNPDNSNVDGLHTSGNNSVENTSSIIRNNNSGIANEILHNNSVLMLNSSNILTENEGAPETGISRPPNNAEIMSNQNDVSKYKTKSTLKRSGDFTRKKCEYQKLCSRFLASLSLPDAYFSSDITCYCESCHKARGEEAVYTKANGVEYYRPLGWCQFNLISRPSDFTDSWHMAYCATRPGHIRRMLDKGELLFPGELELSMPRFGRRTKDEDSGGSQLSFSPNISVVDGAETVNVATSLLERSSGKSYGGRILLQVAVKPGAYKKLESSESCSKSVGGNAGPGNRISNAGATDSLAGSNSPRQRIKWVTKERGATQLLALMIAVDHIEK